MNIHIPELLIWIVGVLALIAVIGFAGIGAYLLLNFKGIRR